VTGFTPRFFEQTDGLDTHAPIHGLAHVVDRQEAYLYRAQGLHLDPGPAPGLYHRAAMDRRFLGAGFELDCDPSQGQGVTQGHQLGGPLGPHDAGDTCDRQHIAFLVAAAANQGQGLRFHANQTFGHGYAVGRILGAHVHHMDRSGFIEMGQIAHPQ